MTFYGTPSRLSAPGVQPFIIMSEFDRECRYKYIECDNCGKKNPQACCSRCKMRYYCNKSCQKKDWKQCHRVSCFDSAKGKEDRSFRYNIDFPTPDVDDTCAICSCDKSKRLVVLPGCLHVFCYGCAYEWQNENCQKCPKCKLVMEKPVNRIVEHLARRCVERCSRKKAVGKETEIATRALDEFYKFEYYHGKTSPAHTFYCGQALAYINPKESVRIFRKLLQDHHKATEAKRRCEALVGKSHALDAMFTNPEMLDMLNQRTGNTLENVHALRAIYASPEVLEAVRQCHGSMLPAGNLVCVHKSFAQTYEKQGAWKEAAIEFEKVHSLPQDECKQDFATWAPLKVVQCALKMGNICPAIKWIL